MTRQRKTPHQRAQEALDVAERKVTKLSSRLDMLEQQQHETGRELEEAIAARDYAAQHPALQDRQEDEAQPEAPAEDGA